MNRRFRTRLRRAEATVRRRTARYRLLPHFVVVGGQRCGTTTLYDLLTLHPCVGRARRKEVHFFDLRYELGIDWYRAQFPTRIAAGWHRLRHDGVYVTGEASPYYLFDPEVPDRLASLLPEARLLAILREPVARTVSHYHHERRKRREPLTLAEALDREEERLEAAERSAGSGSYFTDRRVRSFSYLARSRYAEQLERWLRHFPREQMLVVSSEELFTNSDPTLDRIFTFLGLPPWRAPRVPRLNGGRYAGIDAGLRARLERYFRPHNERLYALIGRDFGWETGHA